MEYCVITLWRWWLCMNAGLRMMVADNKLGDEGMVALAPALGKLVALVSLDLSCTWLHMRRVGGRGSENWSWVDSGNAMTLVVVCMCGCG